MSHGCRAEMRMRSVARPNRATPPQVPVTQPQTNTRETYRPGIRPSFSNFFNLGLMTTWQ